MSLVCWSGGCDSTLVLYDLAIKATKEDPVRALSIVSPQFPAIEAQRHARERIKQWLKKKKVPLIDYNEVELKYDNRSDFSMETGGGLIQPATWIPIAATFLKEKEDLYLGYIRGDDFWHYQAQAYWAFKYLQEISRKQGVLKTPLEWQTKDDVIRKLKEIGLFKLCWTCERPSPKEKSCGKCVPCCSMNSALWRLSKEPKPKKTTKKDAIKISSVISKKQAEIKLVASGY
jgi:7-cyano-7-deazaguanine synthase in queuosine biosynthesis